MIKKNLICHLNNILTLSKIVNRLGLENLTVGLGQHYLVDTTQRYFTCTPSGHRDYYN